MWQGSILDLELFERCVGSVCVCVCAHGCVCYVCVCACCVCVLCVSVMVCVCVCVLCVCVLCECDGVYGVICCLVLDNADQRSVNTRVMGCYVVVSGQVH